MMVAGGVTNLNLLPPTEESLELGIAELTETELRVLSLMAAGLSNEGIACELIVGRRTVESHIATIFVKLRLWPDEPRTNRRVRAVLAYQRRCASHPALEAA